MSKIIEEYFNGNFHFVPPPLNNTNDKKNKLKLLKTNISLEESLRLLHLRIGDCLNLTSEINCIDIGCGIGAVIEDLAETGAQLTGITIASNEVLLKLKWWLDDTLRTLIEIAIAFPIVLNEYTLYSFLLRTEFTQCNGDSDGNLLSTSDLLNYI